MAEPAQVAVEEGTKVVHAVFQHGEPIDAGAEGEPLPFVGIEPAGFEHARVDHAGAEDLHPAVGAADHAAPVLDRVADIDLGRRLGEGEITRTQAEHDRSEEHTSELQSLMRISYAVV